MGRLQKKAEKKIDEAFPDEKLTGGQMARLREAIKKAGGRTEYLLKKNVITRDKSGHIAVVMVEGLNGMEVVKGTGLRYRSNIPYDFWSHAFSQIDKFEYGLNQGNKQLEKFYESIKP